MPYMAAKQVATDNGTHMKRTNRIILTSRPPDHNDLLQLLCTLSRFKLFAFFSCYIQLQDFILENKARCSEYFLYLFI